MKLFFEGACLAEVEKSFGEKGSRYRPSVYLLPSPLSLLGSRDELFKANDLQYLSESSELAS